MHLPPDTIQNMLFNSLQFLLFFGTVTSLYFALEGRQRIYLLLAASCWFYMAFVPVYISILFLTIFIDYFAGIWIAHQQGWKRKWLLVLSIVSNIGILGFFKYHNFFAENINELCGKFGWSCELGMLKYVLPIGLSFHTFQALSYTIEVYRGNQKPERDFTVYALYVMFYPQLVAGPIERPQNMLHQFHEPHPFNRRQFREGILIILWGLLKKVAIADRLALIVDPVYNSPWEQSAANILIVTVLFAIQIYCDFSAYSEIAYGTAHLMGYRLMENFRTPYFSTSISEFWSRWHISLSTWFKDYVYIPLGGNKVGFVRNQLNLFAVFAISGFWHGANWGFIIWGALHGMYLVAANLRKKLMPNFMKVHPLLNGLVVFALCCFAWIFFRAGSITKSLAILRGLKNGGWHLEGIAIKELVVCFVLICLLLGIEWKYKGYQAETKNYWLRIVLLAAAVYFMGVFTGNQFIYFQF